jgi:hypothetical protein
MSGTSLQEIRNLFQQAKNDPSLFSQLNVDEILNTIENDKYNYLENKTLMSISQEVLTELQKIKYLDDIIIQNYHNKLKEYVLVTEIFELKKGHYIRYIKKNETKLHTGSVFLDVKFKNGGVYLMVVSWKTIVQIKMDDFIIFQKLTPEEKLVLLSFEQIK